MVKSTSGLRKIPGGESSFSDATGPRICPLVNEGCRRVLSFEVCKSAAVTCTGRHAGLDLDQ